jgi:branched-chain amino acid transport system substrate-binding protein
MMRKVSLSVFLVMVFAAASLVMMGCSKGPSGEAGKGTIKIGYISSLSGPFAGVANYCTPAVQMAIDKANEAGGFNGRKFELVIRDDTGDASVIAQKANELVGAGCVVVLGGLLDPCDKALSAWAKDAKVPTILTSSTSLALRTTDFNKYSFCTVPASFALATIYAQNISKQDVKSIAFIGADMAIAHDIFNMFWPKLDKLKPGVKNLGATWVGGTEMEFSNIISATLAKKPDMILSGIAGPPWVNFVQQGQRFNLFEKTKVAGSYLLGAELTEPFKKTYPKGIQAPTWSPFYLDDKAMQDFVKAYLDKTKLYPADLTMVRYVSGLAAVEAIKKAGGTEADKIVAALETMSFDTPIGSIHYRDFDHQAVIPIWYVTSGYSDQYPLAIGLNPTKYGEEIYPTKDEIMALRASK